MILTKFHYFDVWHTILEGQGKSKICFIKNRFSKFLTDSSIFDLFSSQKSSLSLLRDENFFSLNISNGASKNSYFRTDFKNVHMTLVKSAPKKGFSQKAILPVENLLKSPKNLVFLGKTFFWCTFY